MSLWKLWTDFIEPLRSACKRRRTFMWMCVVLVGFVVRPDLLGVTSMIRATGLCQCYYDRLLDLFHSPALVIDALTTVWVSLVQLHFPLVRINGRIIVVGDGLNNPKSGKKMPGVKKLHQESDSNTKPEYILGHACQALAVLAGTAESVFAVPLICRIHAGIKETNRDRRTLLDKMATMLTALALRSPYYFVADAYYAARKSIRPILTEGNHLVTRVRNNSVAYYPPEAPATGKRGRPRKYGRKVYLRSFLTDEETMQEALSPVYGEDKTVIRYRMIDLMWKPAGQLVRFVVVIHPTRGSKILMSTDLSLEPVDVIRIYGLRFKIEVSFKQAIRTVGAFGYHFWMADMKRIDRRGRVQFLHRCTRDYREKVRRKIDAYHRYIQLGLIAQGTLQYLACCHTKEVWKSFGSWIRTIRPDILPSEMVTSIALRNTFVEFLADKTGLPRLAKFLRSRIDTNRAEGARLVA